MCRPRDQVVQEQKLSIECEMFGKGVLMEDREVDDRREPTSVQAGSVAKRFIPSIAPSARML